MPNVMKESSMLLSANNAKVEEGCGGLFDVDFLFRQTVG